MIAFYIESKIWEFIREIKYTADFVFSTLGFEYKFITKFSQLQDNDILFFYGPTEPDNTDLQYLAFEKIMFYIPFEPSLYKPLGLSKKQIREFSREIKFFQTLPVISREDFDDPIYYFKDQNIFLGRYNFDILGNIFFNLSSYENFIAETTDDFERITDDESVFLENSSFPFVNGFLWLIERFLQDAIKARGNVLLIKKETWPQAEDFAAVISHNINKLQKWSFYSIFKSSLEDILCFYKIKYVINNFISKMKYILTNIEEYWNFDVIDEIEAAFNINSTYFLGTESKVPEDIDYKLNDDDLLSEIRKNLANGNEIALLGSINSCKDDLLGKQKELLQEITNRNRVGVRQNLFRYDPEITPEYHHKYSFVYDSTRSFLKRSGFKNGVAFPFHVFSKRIPSQKEKIFFHRGCLEIPLTFSDTILKLSKFKTISLEKAKELISSIIEAIQNVNGLISLDFSISNFTEIKFLKQLFTDMLKEITDKNVFIKPFLEIAEWWNKRNSVVIKIVNDEISIYFPDNLDNFTIRIFGDYKVFGLKNDDISLEKNQFFFSYYEKDKAYEIEGAKVKLKADRIYFSDIKSDTTLKIKLSKIEPEKEQ